MSDWHVSFGIGEDSGSYLSWGFGKIVIIIKKIIGKIKEILFPQYYDAIFKVPVEKLSVIKERNKMIDISQLKFEEKPIMSWEDMKKFYKPKKQSISKK